MSVNTEIWAPVEGFPGCSISTSGRVRGVSGKIMKPWNDGDGCYNRIHLRRDGKSFALLIHRLMAIAFLPNPDNLPQVNHKNGIKTDNRLNNFEWVTASQNTKHAHENGLMPDSAQSAFRAKHEQRRQQTHCKHGHLLDGLHANGRWRFCKTCGRKHSLNYARRKK